MKKLKEENFRLFNELNQKIGLPEMSRETFDKEWNEEKKESGEDFPRIAEAVAITVKETINQMDAKTVETTSEVIISK